jgi:sugar lactone lactonase YvrE
VAVDGVGNLYIADTDNSRIRRVDTAGVITTVAGNDTFDPPLDGVSATSSTLSLPGGVAIDGLGKLYIADTFNSRIRRVDTSGVITTVAGALDPEGMGPIAQARLADPQALVVSSSFSWFAGGSSGTVQAVRAGSGLLDVVAGRYPQPTAIGSRARLRDDSFGDVGGVAFDEAAGVAYLTESSANRLHVVTMVDPADPTTWTITPFANPSGTLGFADGALASAKFRRPTGLYLDLAAHSLYVADTGNHVVRAIDLSTGTVQTIAGTPATRGYFGDGAAATSALLYAPQAITRCGNGDLFVADTGNHRVRRIEAATGAITTVLGDGTAASSGDGLPATTFPVHAPLGLACDALGNLFVTSTTTVRLVPANASGVVDGSGEVQTIYGAAPATTFPERVTRCLTGLAVIDDTTVQVTDSCTGLLVSLHREPR